MPTRRRHSRGTGSGLPPRLVGLLQLTVAVYLLLALREQTVGWWDVLTGTAPREAVWRGGQLSGPLGGLLGFTLRSLLGAAWCWWLPLWLAWRGAAHLVRGDWPLQRWEGRSWLVVLAAVAWLGCEGGVAGSTAAAARWGGVVGFYLAAGVTSLVGRAGALLFLGTALLVAGLIWLEPWLGPVRGLLGLAGDGLRRLAGGTVRLGRSLARIPRLLLAAGGRLVRSAVDRLRPEEPDEEAGSWSREEGPAADEVGDRAGGEEAPSSPRTVHAPPAEAPAGAGEAPAPVVTTRRRRGGGSISTAVRARPDAQEAGELPLPDISLLTDPPASSAQISADDLHAAADLLEEKLRSFGVEGSVSEVRPGPVVTTYEFKPAPGVTVNAIVRRANDLALAMEARSIRMEAPIPGKAAVGIEIPNPVQETVYLKEVFVDAADRMAAPLDIVLGKDVFGEPVVIDLAAQPHLLVAGATGSGKSVCVNAMITTLLLRCSPATVRFLLIDPKMLELNVYNGIPHLLHPVITDPKEALRALKWLEAEMDQRYRRLARHGVRNIEAYNRKVAEGEIAGADGETVSEPMPYLLCIVDELADLMVQLGQEIELPITRLAQKARAIGIHLILATQRPSVDVLTGVIKANIPCRIAFRVIQRNDSRTILDTNGAEQLLGKGDMLYLQPGRAKPRRVHGAFVDIQECEAVAEHWRSCAARDDGIDLSDAVAAGGDEDLEMDPLFERAREIVVRSQHGSTSMLQRKLGVGYARAGRLMDLLERAGVVGPFVGSKAREVLMRPDELDALEAEQGGDDQ